MEKNFVDQYNNLGYFIYIGMPVFVLLYVGFWINGIRYIQGKKPWFGWPIWADTVEGRVVMSLGIVAAIMSFVVYYLGAPAVILLAILWFGNYVITATRNRREINLKKRGIREEKNITWDGIWYDDDVDSTDNL